MILTEEAEALWLDPVTEDSDIFMPLLMHYPPEDMAMREVSNLVNSVNNQDPELIESLTGGYRIRGRGSFKTPQVMSEEPWWCFERTAKAGLLLGPPLALQSLWWLRSYLP